MEQMYLIEIFIDKVTIFASDTEDSGANKSLIIKIKFGPKVQFIIKEGQMAKNETVPDDIVECDENGRRKWSRTIRVGKSYLFPSYPDTVLMTLSKFPLEIEVWNDDENEVEIFVGIGTMQWDTQFFHMLKESAEACKLHEPLSIKQRTPLQAECCCGQVGEITFILRVSALGEAIITEFQQLMKDPETFVFRTDKAPSMFSCKRIEGDDPNFCMVGSLYETTTLEDPDVVNAANNQIEVCTELQSCGIGKSADTTCQSKPDDEKKVSKKQYAIDKIRMGDITGPCGNTNCPLAHKVRCYIRNLESYKKKAQGISSTKDTTGKICGACDCKDDRYHREECPSKIEEMGKKAVCMGCGGVTEPGHTCKDQEDLLKSVGPGSKASSPKQSGTTVAYVFSVHQVPGFNEAMFGREFTYQNLNKSYNPNRGSSPLSERTGGGCSCRRSNLQAEDVDTKVVNSRSTPNVWSLENKSSTRSLGSNNQLVYNVSMATSSRKVAVYNCTEIPEDKECKCSPPKQSPPCKTFDCDCLTETMNVAARKKHKPYCPLYKHKSTCPVTMMLEDEENKKIEDDEDAAEPLPYGLPPIKLGPCPVIGRPCSVPDGFARMYKTAAQPPQPPSYSDAGKICCSKEYERIKTALKEYLKNEKEHDLRCVNKFNVDTEKRCCDKEQVLLSLMGKSCCGTHKLALRDKFKKDEP